MGSQVKNPALFECMGLKVCVKKFFILAAILFLYDFSLCFLNALFLYNVLIVALKGDAV